MLLYIACCFALKLPLNSGQLSFLFILCSAVAVSLGILLFWYVGLRVLFYSTVQK